jgi:hypothetical protein
VNGKTLTLALWFVTAVAASGLGGARANAGDLYRFVPPPGWSMYTQTNYADRADADWRGPISGGFAENILVMVRPTTATLEQATDQAALQKVLPGAQLQMQDMTICDGHPAKYAYVLAPFHGATLISEQVVSVWNNVLYQAVYTRMNDQPTIAAARSSLVTLCPASSAPGSTSW